MKRSETGFTLLEVLAAVALLGILYTTLAGVAIQGLRAAADLAPDTTDAQRAWVLLGRVYADKLGDHARAREIFGQES